MAITALYAGLLTVLFLVLSFRVIGVRRGQRVEIGDGGDKELLRRTRVHGNFAEYAPLALVLMGLAESMKAAPWTLHLVGIALLLGRVAHAYGLSQTPHVLPLRVGGMVLTFTALSVLALACLVLSWRVVV